MTALKAALVGLTIALALRFLVNEQPSYPDYITDEPYRLSCLQFFQQHDNCFAEAFQIQENQWHIEQEKCRVKFDQDQVKCLKTCNTDFKCRECNYTREIRDPKKMLWDCGNSAKAQLNRKRETCFQYFINENCSFAQIKLLWKEGYFQTVIAQWAMKNENVTVFINYLHGNSFWSGFLLENSSPEFLNRLTTELHITKQLPLFLRRMNLRALGQIPCSWEDCEKEMATMLMSMNELDFELHGDFLSFDNLPVHSQQLLLTKFKELSMTQRAKILFDMASRFGKNFFLTSPLFSKEDWQFIIWTYGDHADNAYWNEIWEASSRFEIDYPDLIYHFLEHKQERPYHVLDWNLFKIKGKINREEKEKFSSGFLKVLQQFCVVADKQHDYPPEIAQSLLELLTEPDLSIGAKLVKETFP